MSLFQLWLPQGICSVIGLLGHMVVLFLVLKEISILLSIEAVPVYLHTNSVHTLSSIYCLQIFLFYDGHSDWCEVILRCSFELHFSNDEQLNQLKEREGWKQMVEKLRRADLRD